MLPLYILWTFPGSIICAAHMFPYRLVMPWSPHWTAGFRLDHFSCCRLSAWRWCYFASGK